MKTSIATILFILCLSSLSAQKINYHELLIQFPKNYDNNSIIVENGDGIALTPFRIRRQTNTIDEYYKINIPSSEDIGFSVYFGKMLKGISDTLYFQAKGEQYQIKVIDSNITNVHFHLKLKNVYNLEELYSRYLLIKAPAKNRLQKRLDFVKRNISNPYSVDLFSIFVINPRNNYEFLPVYNFYTKFLVGRIKDQLIKKDIEQKINLLKESINEGRMAPAFSDTTIAGLPISNKTLLGKNSLIVFWATWCKPCIEEQPLLMKLKYQYQNENIRFIAISCDKNKDKFDEFIGKHDFNWEHLFNSRSMISAFRVNPIPSIFFIDESGKILYNMQARKHENLELTELKQLLNEKFTKQKK